MVGDWWVCKRRKGGGGYVGDYSTYLLMHLTHKYEMLCDCSLAEDLAGWYL